MKYYFHFIKYVHSIKYGLAVGFTSDQWATVFPVWSKLFVMVLWSGKWLYTFQRLFLRCFKLFHCNMEQILAFQPWKKKQAHYTAETNQPLTQIRTLAWCTNCPPFIQLCFAHSGLNSLLSLTLWTVEGWVAWYIVIFLIQMSWVCFKHK